MGIQRVCTDLLQPFWLILYFLPCCENYTRCSTQPDTNSRQESQGNKECLHIRSHARDGDASGTDEAAHESNISEIDLN